jgi:hypothetical protein
MLPQARESYNHLGPPVALSLSTQNRMSQTKNSCNMFILNGDLCKIAFHCHATWKLKGIQTESLTISTQVLALKC